LVFHCPIGLPRVNISQQAPGVELKRSLISAALSLFHAGATGVHFLAVAESDVGRPKDAISLKEAGHIQWIGWAPKGWFTTRKPTGPSVISKAKF
jgi:hypothetical protein